MNQTVVLFILLLVLFFIGSMWLARWRINRAAAQVIDVFIQQGATSSEKAKSISDLGLATRRFRMTRDYRQMALTILLRNGLVMRTEDGRFYLTQQAYERHLASHQETPRKR
ncbi:MAG: hypothetical protein HYX87_02565 [Chloroflexi bacterium]|nr:hypothetical protein [Chloroflexota bacterium]